MIITGKIRNRHRGRIEKKRENDMKGRRSEGAGWWRKDERKR